jgi:hypothetical protein
VTIKIKAKAKNFLKFIFDNFFFFFFTGLPRWRNGQACRIGPYPSVHDDSEEAVLAAKS